MKSPLSRAVFLLAATGLAACAGPGEPPVPPAAQWLSQIGRDHPLAGRIWSPGRARFAEAWELSEALAGARFVLLGETHDNLDHHRIQAWLVEGLIRRGRRPAVAFEMLSTDQEPALTSYLAAHPRDAAGLGAAVGWADTGWPDWSAYRPIAQAALDAGLPILAANLPRRSIHEMVKEGVGALGAERVRALALGEPMPPTLAARMRHEIVAGHCRQLPEPMVDPMVAVMMARDAFMADAMRRGGAAILIAGAGHARTDHGVPYHLRRLAPGNAIASLALVEIVHGDDDPTDYADQFGAPIAPYDFVWFTARAEREDPCERFGEQLRRAKRSSIQRRNGS